MLPVLGATIFLTAYLASSFILMRKPHWLHKTKKFPFIAQHISHRGGAAEQIENSIEAFRNSQAVGTQMFELDCHLTKDGEVVVLHDKLLERCFGVSGLVTEFNYTDLPSYMPSLRVQFEPGQICVCSSVTPARIPRLRDIFEEFPDMPINIDIKDNDDCLIQQVSDLIDEYNRNRITIWGGMNRHIFKKCRRINPTTLTYPPPEYAFLYLIAYYCWLLPFLPISFDCFELPLISVLRSKHAMHGHNPRSLKLRIFWTIVDFLFPSSIFYEHVKRRGLPVFMWVVNSDSEFRAAFEMGATGVMTDYPTRLSAYLNSKQK